MHLLQIRKTLFIFISIFALFGMSAVLSAQTLDIYKITATLSPSQQETLLQGTPLTTIVNKRNKQGLQYTPSLRIFGKLNTFIKKKPHILYESLFFFKEPNAEKRNLLFIKIANQLRNAPILADIEYKNLKDGNIHPLFTSSKPVQSSTGANQAPSLPLLSMYPDTMHRNTMYVRQGMPPFGDVNSLYQYVYNADYFQFNANNTTKISYSGFRAVKIGNMFTSCSIIMTEQGLLLYGIGSVKLSGIASLLRGVIENSFTSRMVGLFQWLGSSLGTSDY